MTTTTERRRTDETAPKEFLFSRSSHHRTVVFLFTLSRLNLASMYRIGDHRHLPSYSQSREGNIKYHMCSITMSPSQSAEKRFPFTLFRILEDAKKLEKEDIVSWMDEGKCFRVHKRDQFVSEIMPRYFKSFNIRSFHRQLTHYGFQRIETKTSPFYRCYCHKNFIQSEPDLCLKIKRPSSNGKNNQAQETIGRANRKPKSTVLPSPVARQEGTTELQYGRLGSLEEEIPGASFLPVVETHSAYNVTQLSEDMNINFEPTSILCFTIDDSIIQTSDLYQPYSTFDDKGFFR